MQLSVAVRKSAETKQSGSEVPCAVLVFPTRRSMKTAYLNGRALLDRRHGMQMQVPRHAHVVHDDSTKIATETSEKHA